MTLWILIFPLIVLAIVFALWPLIKGGKGDNRLAQAISFYEARKLELLRQRESGEITQIDCDAALAEQARSLLALARAEKAVTVEDEASVVRRRKLASLIMLIGLPAFSLGLYLRLGAPDLPDVPLVSRQAAPQNFDIVTALQKIEAHLAKNPDDGRGFEVVAPVYLKAGRFADAAHAYQRVLVLLGETPERLSDLGESLVASNSGIVSVNARQAFERSVKLDPEFAKPRFYLALAREQDGDSAGALADLTKIASDLPDGPARMRVISEIERFRVEGKGGVAGPQSDAGKTIAGLPQQDRDAAIKGMVEALDVRLSASGGTPEEWRRLIQSRFILNQRDLAEAALEKARTVFPGNTAVLAEFEALAAAHRSEPALKIP